MSLIWESDVDEGEYRVAVVRVSNYAGTLQVFRRGQSAPFFEKEVGLAYGAVLGPDVDDLQSWQETALEQIDADIANGGKDGESETNASS